MAETVRAPRGRPNRREAAGFRNRLAIHGSDPSFVYRIVNDTDGRVAYFENLGYELCKHDEVKVVGKRQTQPDAKDGGLAVISVGGGVKSYVVKIRKDWYEEDQAKKQAHIDELEQTTKRDADKEGFYGKVSLTRG